MTLREARETFGLTQREVSKRAGLAQTIVSRIETGKLQASSKEREAILKGLNCHPDLIDWDLMLKLYRLENS